MKTKSIVTYMAGQMDKAADHFVNVGGWVLVQMSDAINAEDWERVAQIAHREADKLEGKIWS